MEVNAPPSVQPTPIVLLTGATGTVGLEVLAALSRLPHNLQVVAGVRDPKTDTPKLPSFPVRSHKFDFTDPSTYRPALQLCEVLFLLRPPQLSDVEKYFKPLIAIAKEEQVKHIVFLSVQGVENSPIIPHHKIEKLIVESGIGYTFLRPAYFMQNFTTTLRDDLVRKKQIYLPAGKAKFTLIDVRDIAEVAARILIDSAPHLNKAYDLTSPDKPTFGEMAEQISAATGVQIRYKSPNLLAFYLAKRRENLPPMLILVMIMLHFLPRFQPEPPLSNWVEKITGRQPTSFQQFCHDYSNALGSKS